MAVGGTGAALALLSFVAPPSQADVTAAGGMALNSASTASVRWGAGMNTGVVRRTLLESASDVRTAMGFRLQRSTRAPVTFTIALRGQGSDRQYELQLRLDRQRHPTLRVVRSQNGPDETLWERRGTWTVRPGVTHQLTTVVRGGDQVDLHASLRGGGDSLSAHEADTAPRRIADAGRAGVTVATRGPGVGRIVRLTPMKVQVLDRATTPGSPSSDSDSAASVPGAPSDTGGANSQPAPSAGGGSGTEPSGGDQGAPTPESDESWPAAGLVQPGAGNTGVPDGVSLTRVDGDLVITTPGTVLDRVDVRGFVQVRAADVTIRRSVIRGGVATVDTGLVNVTTAGASLVMEDSTLIPQSPSYRIDGVRGSNFTLRRVEITGTVDGVHVHGSTDVNDGGNVRVESSWLHDFTFYPNDPRHSDGSHNDAVQIIGGKGIALVGNTMTGANNAAVQVTQNRNVVANVTMDRNWADNGGCTFNINRNPRAVMSGIVMTGNRFGRATRNSNCAIVISRDQPHTSSGNVWLDNGQAVTIKTG